MTLTRLSDGKILEVNEGFEQIYGFERSEALGQTTRHLELWANPADRDEIVSELRRVGSIREREVLFRRKSGETFDGLLSAEVISVDDEQFILSTHSDITERKRLEEEIRQLSLLDALTNLRNRRGFAVAVEQLVKEAQRECRKLHFIFLDADGLKSINDAHGHEEGDRALTDVANLLRKTFRDSDVIARLGGDGFCVCVMALPDPDSSPDAFLGRLRSNLDAAASQSDRPYRLSLSWGLATWDPTAPKTLEEILADADAAMYQQKRAKRGV
jgi:diguanylate cyclase (GGDEF)-like protein/PAS domain S-box-containing protein